MLQLIKSLPLLLLLACSPADEVFEPSSDNADTRYGSVCGNLCESALGSYEHEGCDNLCNEQLGHPLDGTIGAGCSENADCEGENSFCHPDLRVCTEECEGICPGVDTFCVKLGSHVEERFPPSAERTLEGLCLLKIEGKHEGFCEELYPKYQSFKFAECSTFYIKMNTEFVANRYLGNSDASFDTARMCEVSLRYQDDCTGTGVGCVTGSWDEESHSCVD